MENIKIEWNDENRYSQEDLSVLTEWPLIKNYNNLDVYEEDYQKAVAREDNRIVFIKKDN